MMRYAGRPVMAESRLLSYDNKTDDISWFYEDHKASEKIIVEEVMIDNIEKTVLMKCEYCGYPEKVQLETLLNLRDLKENEENKRDRVLCQFCLNYMYPVDDTLLKQQ